MGCERYVQASSGALGSHRQGSPGAGYRADWTYSSGGPARPGTRWELQPDRRGPQSTKHREHSVFTWFSSHDQQSSRWPQEAGKTTATEPMQTEGAALWGRGHSKAASSPSPRGHIPRHPQLPSWKRGQRRWLSQGQHLPKGAVLNRDRSARGACAGLNGLAYLGRRVRSGWKGRFDQILKTSWGYIFSTPEYRAWICHRAILRMSGDRIYIISPFSLAHVLSHVWRVSKADKITGTKALSSGPNWSGSCAQKMLRRLCPVPWSRLSGTSMASVRGSQKLK